MEQAVVDSAGIATWLTNTFPGLHPPFIALVAGWLASRALWLVKWLVALGGLNLPLAERVRDAIIGGTTRGWGKIAWLVNPLLMIFMGYLASGGDIGLGTLIGFAGIGVREWLIKSPIPTSKEELNKLKAAF